MSQRKLKMDGRDWISPGGVSIEQQYAANNNVQDESISNIECQIDE